MVMPAVSYAKTEDGVHLAYTRFGSGPTLVVAGSPMLSCHQRVLSNPKAFTFLRLLAEDYELLLYDERGTGSSGGLIETRTTQTDANDLQAVLRAAGTSKVKLLAAFTSTPAALEWAAGHSELLDRIVLWCPVQHVGSVLESPRARAILGICEVDPDLGFQVLIHSLAGWESGQLGEWMTALYRDSIGVDGLKKLRMLRIDTETLRRVTTETLVIHPNRSQLVDVEGCRRLTASMPNARMMLVDAESIAPYGGDVEETTQVILEALAQRSKTSEIRVPGEWAMAADMVADPPLTPREHDVLQLIAHGDASKEISAQLQISVNTVDRHISNIYRKLGVRGRAQAAAFAVKQGFG
ncbi:MAG: LuxR C-terminal-related transcriptional regulator [Chloroflexi bacterium]|nr:LuxR C-terminal-related transcriptional regulator [Chloroflexota bacterium]